MRGAPNHACKSNLPLAKSVSSKVRKGLFVKISIPRTCQIFSREIRQRDDPRNDGVAAAIPGCCPTFGRSVSGRLPIRRMDFELRFPGDDVDARGESVIRTLIRNLDREIERNPERNGGEY